MANNAALMNYLVFIEKPGLTVLLNVAVITSASALERGRQFNSLQIWLASDAYDLPSIANGLHIDLRSSQGPRGTEPAMGRVDLLLV